MCWRPWLALIATLASLVDARPYDLDDEWRSLNPFPEFTEGVLYYITRWGWLFEVVIIVFFALRWSRLGGWRRRAIFALLSLGICLVKQHLAGPKVWSFLASAVLIVVSAAYTLGLRADTGLCASSAVLLRDASMIAITGHLCIPYCLTCLLFAVLQRLAKPMCLGLACLPDSCPASNAAPLVQGAVSRVQVSLWALAFGLARFLQVLFDVTVMQRHLILLDDVFSWSTELKQHLRQVLLALGTQLHHPILKPLGLLYSFALRLWDFAFEHDRYFPSANEANLLFIAVLVQQLLGYATRRDFDGLARASIILERETKSPWKKIMFSSCAKALSLGLELGALEVSRVIVRTITSGSLWGAWDPEPWELVFLTEDVKKDVLVQLRFVGALLTPFLVAMALSLVSVNLTATGSKTVSTLHIQPLLVRFGAMFCTLVGVWVPRLQETVFRTEERAVQLLEALSTREDVHPFQQQRMSAALARQLRSAAFQSVRLSLTFIPVAGYAAKLGEYVGGACPFWAGSAVEGNIHPSGNWRILPCCPRRRTRNVGSNTEVWLTPQSRPLGDPVEYAFVYVRPDGPYVLENPDPSQGELTFVRAPWLSINLRQGLFTLIDVLTLAAEQSLLFNWNWLPLPSLVWLLVGLCWVRGFLEAWKKASDRSRDIKDAPDECRAFGLASHGFGIPRGGTLCDVVTWAVDRTMEQEIQAALAADDEEGADAQILRAQFEWSAGETFQRIVVRKRDHALSSQTEMLWVKRTLEKMLRAQMQPRRHARLDWELIKEAAGVVASSAAASSAAASNATLMGRPSDEHPQMPDCSAVSSGPGPTLGASLEESPRDRLPPDEEVVEQPPVLYPDTPSSAGHRTPELEDEPRAQTPRVLWPRTPSPSPDGRMGQF